MFLIVGLGNPGKQYLNTRHNVGFMAADFLSSCLSFSSFAASNKFKGEVASGNILGNKALLLKPSTFMNLSGESVSALSNFYKILPSNIIVIHDDIDLKLGDVRVKLGGGHAGHNGLRSINSYIGADYLRIRIGVGRPDNKDEVANYVLDNFSKDEKIVINEKLFDMDKFIKEALK